MGSLAPPGEGATDVVAGPVTTTDAVVRGGVRPLRLLDDTAVDARHIVRATAATPGAVEILPGQWWAPAARNGLEGDQGWVSASTERRLSDQGLLQALVLPNATGPDGIQHKQRFALRNGERAQVGEEWIELTDHASQREHAVVSPTGARVDRSTVTVSGVDAGALLAPWREGKIAPWTPTAAVDVVDHYSQAPTAEIVDDMRSVLSTGWSPTLTLGSTPALVPGTLTQGADGITMVPTTLGDCGIKRDLTYPTPATGSWQAHADVRLQNDVGGKAAGCWLALTTEEGDVAAMLQLVAGPTGPAWVSALAGDAFMRGRVPRPEADAVAELAIYARPGWYIFTVNGQVAARLRRPAADAIVTVTVGGGLRPFTVSRCQMRVARPMLRRSAPAADYRVAGAPPAGGLRGDYYLAANEWAESSSSYSNFWARSLAPLAEPYQSRVDPSIEFDGSVWMPPGPPGGRQFAVRWSGSIYLPLAERDCWVGRYGGTGTAMVGMARIWIGSTRADIPYLDATSASETQADQFGDSLRTHLGSSESGWYPVVIEYAVGQTTANPRIRITCSTGPTAFSQAVVPSTALSPYGCWEGDLGGESHRAAIDSVCTSMGLQWRIQPRRLESGEFPGRLEVGAQLGQQTDKLIGEDDATEYLSETDGAEVCNHIVADGAGLGRPDGSDQGLTVEIVDPAAAGDPWIASRHEQLQDITERTLMQQRLDSLLALHGSPHEQVSARPRGTAERVYPWSDQFPTTADSRLLTYEPGDGVRLRLPSIGVVDLTPRQMASVQLWLRPAGRLPPIVGFRQRPRHLRQRLRSLERAVATSRRHYQGQIAMLSGTAGATSTTIAPDRYSRLGLPAAGVGRVELRIAGMTGTGTIEVLGTSTGIVVSRPGTYDVTAWVPVGAAEVYAQLTSPTGVYNIQLVATVTV